MKNSAYLPMPITVLVFLLMTCTVPKDEPGDIIPPNGQEEIIVQFSDSGQNLGD